MSDPFLISSAGYLAEYNYAVPPFKGFSQKNYTVRPIPTGSQPASVHGSGIFNVAMSGAKGALDISLVTGEAGTAQAIAFLVDQAPNPTRYLGLALDTLNRPQAFIADQAGVLVSSMQMDDAAILAGETLRLTFSWDSTVPLSATRYALLKHTDTETTQIGWFPNSTKAWTPFTPFALIVGDLFGGSFQSLGNCTGFVDQVVVSILPAVAGVSNDVFAMFVGDALEVSEYVMNDGLIDSIADDTFSVTDSVSPAIL